MFKVDRPTTLNTVFPGALSCLQYRKGYRFNQDSVLLAHFARPKHKDHILDLCAGCGIIGLILAYRFPSITIVSLEIQSDLSNLARRNAIDNGFADRIKVVEGDLNDESLFKANAFDRIVCNPPYLDTSKSRAPADSEVAIARQGFHAGPERIAISAGRLLENGGRLNVVYPAERKEQILAAFKKHGLSPIRLQSVHAHPEAPEMLVMIEAEKNGSRQAKVLPPLYINSKKGGAYSAEMKKCYEP